MIKTKSKEESPPPVPMQVGEVREDPSYAHDAVFGEITEDGPNFRNLGWAGTVALMMKTQIGLGVLSIPSAFDALGIVPGIITLCGIAITTTWSDYIIGVFKLRHPQVYGIDDAGSLLFGHVGKVLFGTAFCLYWTFVAASGMLSTSIALNALSTHSVCTAVFTAIAAIVGFVFASIRTLGRMSFLAWFGLICILTSIMIVTIAVGVQDRPSAAPQDVPWVSNYKIIGDGDFVESISAVSRLVFAFAGTPAFFSIISEMRDPRYYTRSLLICQGTVVAVYVTIGCVVYCYCGSYIASPALGSAGPLMKKVCYGFALPGLFVTTMLVIHLPAKYIFVTILRGSRHLTANTVVHWGTWLSCTFGIAVIAYIIASAIPVFDDLVSLIGALLGTSMAFQPMGCMWLYDNWAKFRAERTRKLTLMVCWSVFIVVLGMFLMVGGTYASVKTIIKSYNASGGSKVWSCADNSNSV